MLQVCTDIVDLGCVPYCAFLKIPIRPLRDDRYYLQYYFDGAWHRYATHGKKGYYLVWTENPLPLNRKVIFEIVDDFGKKLFYSTLKDGFGLDFDAYCEPECNDDCITSFMIQTIMVYEEDACDCPDEFYDPCNDCSDC